MKTPLVLLAISAAGAGNVRAEPTPDHRGFVEVGLGFGYAMSNAQFLEVNNGTLLAPPHASGPELDVGGGYQLVPGIALVGDLQYASATSIQATARMARPHSTRAPTTA